MPEGVKTKRTDPYKNYKFRVKQNNNTVMGVSKVSPLRRTTEVVTHREGGENSTDHKSPGRTTYEGVTMERGVTQDKEFANWANQVHPYDGDLLMDLENYKKELTLEVLNERGDIVLRYFLHDCWVSEFTAVPDLDANSNAVAIETIKLELEGWEKDPDLKVAEGL
ncbi:MAG: phage tail protein [Verrucomicrobiota bacterium]